MDDLERAAVRVPPDVPMIVVDRAVGGDPIGQVVEVPATSVDPDLAARVPPVLAVGAVVATTAVAPLGRGARRTIATAVAALAAMVEVAGSPAVMATLARSVGVTEMRGVRA